LRAWKSVHVRVAPGLFPPKLVVQVKAWACELPSTHDLPRSRWSTTDLAREVCQSGVVASISGSTLWRWLHSAYPQLVLVHAPIHASWLNQVEIYFSIIQRKVLTPNDFPNLDTLAERLLDFQYYWEATAKPFEWKFNRKDLNGLLDKLNIP